MASNLSLQDLVEAIMNAIAEAQNKIEEQTMENIAEWFDDEGRPKMVHFKIPVMGPHAEALKAEGKEPEREILVPLITLMQNNPIKIKRLLTKFDISLGGVDMHQEQDEQQQSKYAKKYKDDTTAPKKRKILSTDLFSGANGKGSGTTQTASMEIEFESGEPTEAYLKMQNELLKLI